MPDDLSQFTTPAVLEAPEPAPLLLAPLPGRPAGPHEDVAAYEAGKEYDILVMPGTVFDLAFEPGEQIFKWVIGDRSLVEAEDNTAVWQVAHTVHGSGDTATPHLLLTVSGPDKHTGLVVTTNRRIYYLHCKAVRKAPKRALRWEYAEASAPQAPPRPIPPPWPDPILPQKYHVGYTLEVKGQPDWVPTWVGDDGHKVYIVLPVTSLYDVAPLVRGIGSTGPFLLNVRQFKNVLIVDQLAGRLELRVGAKEQAEVVTILRQQLTTIGCPGLEQCPQWPPWAPRRS
jgi:type IV secretion system protein VirB9